MTRVTRLSVEFTKFIPDRLAEGVLYVSRRYSTASHLCCCGCGREVVTPLNAAKWRLSERNGSVSLSPSVGNWSFPCKSHYWIVRNCIHWAAEMSPEMIAEVRARDLTDAQVLTPRPASRLAAFRRRCIEMWHNFLKTFGR